MCRGILLLKQHKALDIVARKSDVLISTINITGRYWFEKFKQSIDNNKKKAIFYFRSFCVSVSSKLNSNLVESKPIIENFELKSVICAL
jgi:hypothetical protein